MIQGFFKLILYALLAYSIYLLIRFFRALNRGMKPRPSSPRLSGVMVKDEACNTYLPQEEAIREIIDGREYFFCSKECRKKFIELKKPH